jgi:hypothetical protein
LAPLRRIVTLAARPSRSIAPIELWKVGPEWHRHVTDGAFTPAARASARVASSAPRVEKRRTTSRSCVDSGFRNGEQTTW